uniref:(northern house mosquito) hypothetical protein n=1 Tax=Culex pipiens TaxID=7175 RepID=A0A8D8BG44_CULPI
MRIIKFKNKQIYKEVRFSLVQSFYFLFHSLNKFYCCQKKTNNFQVRSHNWLRSVTRMTFWRRSRSRSCKTKLDFHSISQLISSKSSSKKVNRDNSISALDTLFSAQPFSESFSNSAE